MKERNTLDDVAAFISAGGNVSDPEVKIVYLARARSILAEQQDRARSLDLTLTAFEKAIAKPAGAT